VNDAFGTEINDILLTALGLAVQEQYGHDRLLIAQEGHGREDILKDVDINRTVGWFTSRYPVVIDFSLHSSTSRPMQTRADDILARQIKEVKETLRRVPNKGVGYGILKYLTAPENKAEIQFRLKPQINFNYLGQFDADVEHMSFEPARESAGRNAHPNENNAYQLSVNGILAQNQLGISISYSKEQFKKETIESLLECYKAKLSHVIAYCSDRRKKEITPSDLTYSELSIDAVESIGALFD
jgi:non-ribosomal peptide synthase protein (TIGR01720 family)